MFFVGMGLFHSAHAFFRMPCSQPVVVERADPIVNPGAVSGHLHTVMGGSAFNFTEDQTSALAARCTSCKVCTNFICTPYSLPFYRPPYPFEMEL